MTEPPRININRQTILSQPDIYGIRHYRYVLWREWGMTNKEYAMFVGLNPSTADEWEDDPTIRRCVNYAKSWGYGALCMANLFAYRTVSPSVMKAHPQPVGVDNDRWLAELASEAGVVIAAWGVDGAHCARDKAVKPLLGEKLSYLKLTKDGHPGHPLYLKKTLKPLLLS